MFSFGKKKKSAAYETPTERDGQCDGAGRKKDATPRCDESAASTSSTPRRRSVFGKKKTSEATTPRDDSNEGLLVGEDVVLVSKVDGFEELQGQRAEAILYDFFERSYTIIFPDGRRLQCDPDGLKKAPASARRFSL